jgi:kynurenine formamidase
MAETFTRGGRRYTLYDLSDTLSNSTSAFEPNPHEVQYLDPAEAIAEGERRWGIGADAWPGGRGLNADSVVATTHSGTHVDAPHHYGPTADGGRALTIDTMPLSWCFGPGVRLDVRSKSPKEGVSRAAVETELERIGHELQDGDVVLVWTGTDLRQPGYQNASPGLRRDATEFLVDSGVRLIGIDAWGLDRPFPIMIEEAKSGELEQIWESHILGRTKPYAQIERLANLGELPAPTGFTVYAFPFKIEAASAGFARVVAIVEED